jgi:hypothetical protein
MRLKLAIADPPYLAANIMHKKHASLDGQKSWASMLRLRPCSWATLAITRLELLTMIISFLTRDNIARLNLYV